MEDQAQEYPLEVRSVEAAGQTGGFGTLLLVERRPGRLRLVAVLNSRDAEFLAAAHNACLGLTLHELQALADGGGVRQLLRGATPEEALRQTGLAKE